MWVPFLLFIGLAVAGSVLVSEVRLRWQARAPRRLPSQKWWRRAVVHDRCDGESVRRGVDSAIVVQLQRFASRPGVLVAPEQYSTAPPLPLVAVSGVADISIEVDCDDLVDTTESVALTAAEAADLVSRSEPGFDPGRVRHDNPVIIPSAPLSFSDLEDTLPHHRPALTG